MPGGAEGCVPTQPHPVEEACEEWKGRDGEAGDQEQVSYNLALLPSSVKSQLSWTEIAL